MKKEKLHRDISKHAKRISGIAGTLAPGYDKEQVHNLRTEFKKLRALIRWQYPGAKKIVQPFRKLYHIAGDLRNAAVLPGESRKGELPRFEEWLSEYGELSKTGWEKNYEKRKIEEWVDRIKSLKSTLKKHKSFFSKRKKKTHNLLVYRDMALQGTTIHAIRKMIKDLQYVSEWCEKNNVENTSIAALPAEQLKYAAEEAGIYNDLRMGTGLLLTYIKEEKDDAARDKAVSIRTKWLLHDKETKLQLIKNLKNDLFL